ncbi:hypothetical protein A3F66_05270 [candidate division TM6 bacterium RIFCSPHIGHO2_12_FULL_32_22]|nr:MAG: hypothetical protein A3F66_05270 [candidate division TM6 bacterium RIFCSPHIGHO2_12_FULL_32_22]
MNPKLPKLVHRDFDEKIAEKPIVILTASYNNSKWYKRNLASAFGQNYSNYRIIYIDDCSPDNTGNLVKEYVKLQNQDHRFTLIQNKERGLALYNIYYAIHLCNPEEIVVVLDGDDCFCHNNVLNIINKEYSTKDIWLTHGSCCYLSSGSRIEWCMPIPKNTINDNNFRQWPHGPTHVRTFYAWLFHKINLEDFLDKLGWFYRMSYDVAMFMPMLEMCGSRHSFIDEILYVYNDLNDINDHKVDTHLQHSLNHEIRNKSKYKVLKFGINNDLQ